MNNKFKYKYNKHKFRASYIKVKSMFIVIGTI